VESVAEDGFFSVLSRLCIYRTSLET